MTREEQLDWLCRLRSDISYMDFSIDVQGSLERKRRYRQALSEVIETLKQELIIDKIRAEMKPYTDPKGFIVIGENRFNMILDKYKAEGGN